MDALLRFVGEVYNELGLLGTAALLIATAFVFPLYHAYKKWVSDKIFPPPVAPEIDLTKSLAFARIDSLIKHTIPRLRIYCPLRKAIFQDLLTIELNTGLEYLKRIAEKSNINDIEPDALHDLFELTIKDSFLEAERRVILAGVPEVALKKFRDMNDQNQHIMTNVMETITRSSKIFENNKEKVTIIFDMISVIASTMLVAAEQAIDDLNGELTSIEYKGTVCTKDCPNCKYLEHNE